MLASEREGLERFVDAAPLAAARRRCALLLALARRPRGAAPARRACRWPSRRASCDARARPLRRSRASPRALGWDADAVVARGRALRREEGRP